MSILDTLQAERARYPERINSEQAWAILNAAAWAHKAEGWGLLDKRTGNRNPRTNTAQDVLLRAGLEYDVLEDAPDSFNVRMGDPNVHGGEYWGTAKPYMGTPKSGADMTRFVAPVQPENLPDAPVPDPGTTVPNPGTPEPPKVCPAEQKLAALQALVETLTRTVAETKAIAQVVQQRVSSLEQDVALLKSEPVGYEVTTSRVWGHSHVVKVKA